MTLFFGTIFAATYLRVGPLVFFLPIMFCYSFFDVINKNSLSDEDFYALEDKYLFDLDLGEFRKLLQGKFRPVIALILIIIGLQMLLSNFYGMLLNILPDNISDAIYYALMPVLNKLPQFLIALFIIAVGVRLIKGKKVILELTDKEADFK